MNDDLVIRALANRSRRQILQWLRAPTRHFAVQVDGDLVKDGVFVPSVLNEGEPGPGMQPGNTSPKAH